MADAPHLLVVIATRDLREEDCLLVNRRLNVVNMNVMVYLALMLF